jgi:tetratricopeptide (TPR) repeat protein
MLMLHRVLAPALAVFAAAAPVSLAQANMSGHSMGAMAEIPSPDTLPPPLPMTGIGNSHLDITAKPEAQAWFTQGLNLFHDFWDYESARAFEQGIRVDPHCAMCYWGLYEALQFRGANPYADGVLEQGRHTEHGITKAEKLYLKGADQSNAKAAETYRKILKLNPEDIQASLFLAGVLHDGYTDAGDPKPGTAQAIAVLEGVLKAHPDDSAANHYWIHAMEPSSHPERAIAAAQKLADEAPASGHMVHMPGHIFYRTGDYADAETWFARSTAVDESYMKAQHVSADDDWNYVHNLMYAIADLMEEGKLDEANQLSAKLTRARGQYSATLYTYSPRDQMTRLSLDLPVALREGNWPAVLSMLAAAKTNDKPDARLPNLNFLAGQLQQYATGMQAIESGDVDTAEAASKRLATDLAIMQAKVDAMPRPDPKADKKKETPSSTQPILPDATLKPLVANLSIMAKELRAAILAEKNDLPPSKTLFDEAAAAETKLGYREPPAFILPVRETEGAALLRAGDPAGAHIAFAAALKDRPNSGFALYGLAEASAAAGNEAAALTEYAHFLAAWRDADPSLPQKQQAQAFVDAHPVTAAVTP